jgi:hypothetical protein
MDPRATIFKNRRTAGEGSYPSASAVESDDYPITVDNHRHPALSVRQFQHMLQAVCVFYHINILHGDIFSLIGFTSPIGEGSGAFPVNCYFFGHIDSPGIHAT